MSRVSSLAAHIIERVRGAMVLIEDLDPAEQDLVVGAIVADLRCRRPVAIAPLGVLGPPTDPIRDPRTNG